MWRIFLVLGLFGLSACGLVRERFAPTPDLSDITLPTTRLVEPVQALLENETLLVAMADGTQCRGTAGAAFTSGGWTGVLSECPTSYSYSVLLASGILPDATFLEPVVVDLIPDEDEVPFKPLAAALITLPNGARYRFETPEGF